MASVKQLSLYLQLKILRLTQIAIQQLFSQSSKIRKLGEIIAQGTHSELLESCALYKRLADLQFNQGDDVLAF